MRLHYFSPPLNELFSKVEAMLTFQYFSLSSLSDNIKSPFSVAKLIKKIPERYWVFETLKDDSAFVGVNQIHRQNHRTLQVSVKSYEEIKYL